MSGDIKTRLDTAYDQVYDELEQDGLTIWPKAGPIVDRVMAHLAALMAFNCVPSVPVSDERYRMILDKRNIAKPQIRRAVTKNYTSPDDVHDY